MVAVPTLVRVSPALHAQCRHFQRHRVALFPSLLRTVHHLHGVSCVRHILARACSALRLVACGARHRGSALSRRVLQRHRATPRPADQMGYRRGHRRRRGADRSLAPRRRALDADHRNRVTALRVPRAAPARTDGAQGLVGLTRRIAFLAHLGRRIRRRARCLNQFHLPVRAVRRAARKGRRRQLFHSGRVLAARPVPRRTRQGRRRLVRHDRHDLRLIGRERRHHRYVHDSLDEARRLSGGESRRDRMRGRRQRSAHAAGDGRGRIPDGGICRRLVRGNLQGGVPARDPHLRRTLLCRRSRSREGRHDRPAAHQAPHLEGRRDQGADHDLIARHPELRDLFRSWLDQGRVRRERELARGRRPDCRLHHSGARPRQASRPAAGRSDQTTDLGAGLLRVRAHRPALPAARRGADLVPDGRGDVARARRVLGRHRNGRRGADPAPAHRLLPPLRRAVARVASRLARFPRRPQASSSAW
jgi:hypothetical protein